MADSREDALIYARLNDLVRLKAYARGYSFLPRQPVYSILSGRFSSRVRGRGLDFEELRHYRPGDDIRLMDWKTTNRTRKPHIKVFNEERERPVYILVDQRTNMFFGTQVKMKSVIAAEIAALAAWRVLDVGDRVGGMVFNDIKCVEIRPQRSQKTVMRFLNEVYNQNHALGHNDNIHQNNAQLNVALKGVENIVRHDALVVIVSDLGGWNDESVKRLKRLSRHNDVLIALVFDPFEARLPKDRQLIMSDGNLQVQVDLENPDISEQYEQHYDTRMAYLKNELSKHAIPVMQINTIDSALDQIRSALGQARV